MEGMQKLCSIEDVDEVFEGMLLDGVGGGGEGSGGGGNVDGAGGDGVGDNDNGVARGDIGGAGLVSSLGTSYRMLPHRGVKKNLMLL